MELRSVRKANVADKRVLVRCEFNVPLDDTGSITDDTRIQVCLPTLQYLLQQKAKLVLSAHLGRPKGEPGDEKFSLRPVAVRLGELLGKPVMMLSDCVGPDVEKAVMAMMPGDIIMLENLRFHKEEKKGNPEFAKALATLGELYVNEAFGVCHREDASMLGVTEHLPSYAGLRLEQEVSELSSVLESPQKPLVALVGGAKISDKIKVIKKFLEIADHVCLGGALANNILKAKGMAIGKSIFEEEMMDVAKELALVDTRLHVPVDVVTAKKIATGVPTEIKAAGNVSDDEYILDIGPDTVRLYSMVIAKAKVVVWGGPMGYYELNEFARGTKEVATALSTSGARTIIGGGDTLDAVKRAGCLDKVSFASSGGGAMLKLLEGNGLPAINPLIE
ncbi:MAG: phosphoglycerate kinase [Patescibacteria group bacterium]|nr:phosphoglycerate kinase [Patescibacteria group bacterium]MDD5715193.1 phosphoglycerate kinase [Patescibacteria group bacterium]